MVIPSRLEHQNIRQYKKDKKNKTLILCYFHQKCGFLWNRYRVQKIGQLNTCSFYFLSHKQLTHPLTQKMWSFVENVPGTAIQSPLTLKMGDAITYAIHPTLIQLQISDIGLFSIKNLAAIIVNPDPIVDKKILGRYIIGYIFPFLLRRNPVLSIHGSAIANGQSKAAIFLGDPGAGKSTTAASFSKYGWKMLCDDLITVKSGPIALPGIPLARLLPDAFQYLIGHPDKAKHTVDGSNKFVTAFPEAVHPAALTHMFILRTGKTDKVEITLLSGKDKIRSLVEHANMIKGFDTPHEIFMRITEFFRSVNSYLITRPIDSNRPGQIAEKLIDVGILD